jgi:Bifunctional DNA primase/polymerase, N-terminal
VNAATSEVPGEAALTYAGLGLVVLPLWPGSKIPFASKDGTPCRRHYPETHPPLLGRGFGLDEVGTTDPAVIDQWWSTCPTAGVGIVCGWRSRLLVLDADRHCPEVDGVWSLQEYVNDLDDEGLDLGEVPFAATARRGIHMWFRIDERDAPAKTREVFPGVELLGSDHWVAAPPTVTEHGSYRWAQWYDPTPAPDWLLAELLGKSPLGRTSVRERVIDRMGAGLVRPDTPMPWDSEFLQQGLGIWTGSRHQDAVHLVVRTWHRTNDERLTMGFLRRVWQATEDRPGLWDEIVRVAEWAGVGR